MKFLLLLVTAASAVAAWPFHYRSNCLTDDKASAIIDTFTQALRTPKDSFDTYVSLVQSIANPDYSEHSDSVNFFSGAPIGSVTVSSFDDLVTSHRAQGGPAYFQIDTLNIWHSCDVITWRYRAIQTEGTKPVTSIMALTLGKNGKIDAIFFEFNNAISAENFGYTITPPAVSG
ncbi:hypothetical protein LTR84_006320 [Exophiala bonariae]|uniref:NTF2-like domain-containing protein n=1 Tax=Exophiala bonariae TaxID=1690606 RepID=A0AAV9N0W6_9EURO|nr:hypothetical protein LTR84_006320 [Exophiala bonariae]